MLDDDMFLEDDTVEIKLEEYVKDYTVVKELNDGIQVTVYNMKTTEGLGFLLADKSVAFVIRKIFNKEDVFGVKVLVEGFPSLKSSYKERTKEEVEQFINKYLLTNKEKIEELLQ